MGSIIGLFDRSRRHDNFEALIAPHVNHLYRQAFRFTGNESDAEDLLQDLLLQLYPRCSEMAGIEHLRAWLLRSLYHRFIDNVRHRKNDPLTAGIDHDSIELVASDRADLSAGNDLLHKQLSAALDQLKPEQRAVVALHDMEGYTLEELHNMLDVPLGTLKSRLHRARRYLRSCLKLEPFLDELRLQV